MLKTLNWKQIEREKQYVFSHHRDRRENQIDEINSLTDKKAQEKNTMKFLLAHSNTHTYTSVRPMISGLLSFSSPRVVTTANGSDKSKKLERFFRSLPLNESCNRDDMVLDADCSPILILVLTGKQCVDEDENTPIGTIGTSMDASRFVVAFGDSSRR